MPSPLYPLGRAAFRFAIAYSVISTLIAVALAAGGYPVPPLLTMVPIDPNALVAAANRVSNVPLLAATTTGFAMVGFSILNVVAGIALAFPKLVTAAFAALDPSLAPAGMFVGALLQASVLLYVVESLIATGSSA